MKASRKPKKGSKNNSPENPSESVGKLLLSGAEDAPGLTKLRQKAEAHLSRHPERLDNLSKLDMKQIIHELGTYQIELEMQNEELLKTQQTLEESHRRLADLYDFAPVGYFSLDPNGIIVGVNLIGAFMLGETKNKLIRKSFSLFVDKEHMDIFYFFFRGIMREESRQVAECRLKKKDGTFFYVQLEGLPVRDEEGSIVEIRISISDISQRIVAETSLRHKTSLLRTIIDSTDVMLVYLDREFNFVWVNPVYAASCGMTPEEMAGKNHFFLFPDPENENIFCRVRDTGEPVFYKDKQFQFPDQPERGVTYWDWSLNPVMDADDRVIGLVFSLRETTKYRKMEMALQESEALAQTHALQLQQFLDFTPIPVWIAHDPECREITGNLAAAKLFGIEAHQNVSQSSLSGEQTFNLRIYRNGREMDEQEMPLHYAVANDIRVDDSEITIVLPDGQAIVLLGAAAPLYDAQGKVQGGIGAYMDITERKWMEEQLLQAKQEWERTFDAVPDLISILDPQHRIVRVNHAMAEKYGLSPKQSIGRPCFTCVHGTSHSIENCPHSLTMKDGREHVAQIHEERLGKDFLITNTPLFNEQGEITSTVHVARDITELKKTEKLLLESEKRLKRAQKMAHLGSWELDTVTNVLTWSDEMFSIFGMEPHSFVPSYDDFLALIHSEDRQKLDKIYTDSFREGASEYELEHQIIQKCTGAVRYVYEKCYHYRDKTGNVIRSVGMVQDITERKAAEEKILALNKSLQYSIRELADANRELERSNRDLQQYASIISHDLQEPLRTVSSFIQLLRRRYQSELDDKAKTFINFAVEGTVHMERLLRDLLKFSRVGGGELRLQTVALDVVLEKTLKSLDAGIKESDVQIQSDFLPVVIADEMQLIHLLQNLVSNAIKFRSDEPPRIQISSELAGGEWVICVQDNGIGIDPQYAERIFLIFQRLHRKEEYEGTGIGLAICKKIVERHDGRIWFESKLGQGATFYFSLPAE